MDRIEHQSADAPKQVRIEAPLLLGPDSPAARKRIASFGGLSPHLTTLVNPFRLRFCCSLCFLSMNLAYASGPAFLARSCATPDTVPSRIKVLDHAFGTAHKCNTQISSYSCSDTSRGIACMRMCHDVQPAWRIHGLMHIRK